MRNAGFWYVLGRVNAVFMFAILSLTFSQVVLRYLFNHPVTWIEEISRYLFVWIVFLGSATAFRAGEHIKVDIFERRDWPALQMLRGLITTGALVLLLWSGVLVAWRNRATPSYTLPDFPAVLFYGAVPVATALMLVALWQWMAASRRRDEKKD